MEAKELMIGDLLRISEEGICIKKGTIVEVLSINADDFLKYDGEELKGAAHCRPIGDPRYLWQCTGGVWCAYLEPIPLTAEILGKNGLEKEEDDQSFTGAFFPEDKEVYLEITQERDGRIFWSINYDEYHIIPIKYVHELQHALRLCGIDKEIKL